MKELLEGIYTHYDTVFTGAHALAGKLYHAEAKQNSTFPYVVQSILSQTPEYWFGTEKLEEIVVQFSIFTDDEGSAVNINQYFDDFITGFDDQAVTVSGYGVVYFEREFSNLLPIIERDLWHYVLRYRITLE